MIYIYDGDTTSFRYNGQALPQAYDVVVRQELNGEYFLTANYPISKDGRYQLIEKDKIIKAHTPDGMQPFRVVDIKKHMDHVEVEAWHIFYADFRKKLCRPLKIRQGTGVEAIGKFVQSLLSDTRYTFSSNILDLHDYTTVDRTDFGREEIKQNPDQMFQALDVLGDIVKRWNGELMINGYDIRLVKRIGQDKDILLYDKKNITEYVDQTNIKDIVTLAYGISEWEEEVKTADGDTKMATKRVKAFVESPLINAYNGVVFEAQYVNNDIRSERAMKNWLRRKFSYENRDKPKRNIKLDTNLVGGGRLNFGDGLVLKYTQYDVDERMRMTSYDYNGFDDKWLSIGIGDIRSGALDDLKVEISGISQNVGQQIDQTYHAMINSLGNKIIYSQLEPVGDFKDGDVWFHDNGFHIWDAEQQMWVAHPYNTRIDVVEQLLKDLEPEIKEMRQRNEEVFERAKKLADDFEAQTSALTDRFDEYQEQLKLLDSQASQQVKIIGSDGLRYYMDNIAKIGIGPGGYPEDPEQEGIDSEEFTILVEDVLAEVGPNKYGYTLGVQHVLSFEAESVERKVDKSYGTESAISTAITNQVGPLLELETPPQAQGFNDMRLSVVTETKGVVELENG